MGGATVREVAVKAGVSVSTVSRVFYRPHLISTVTRDRVQRAATELGWRPNPMARALTTGRTGNIGLVVPDIANPFFASIIKAAQNLAWERGLNVFLADSEEDPVQEAKVVEQLVDRVNGLILASSRLPGSKIREVGARQRIVLVNRTVEGVSSVLIDSASGMVEALDLLADLGHCRVAYVAGPAVSWSNQQRHKAIRARARARAVHLVVLGPVVPSFEAGLAIVPQVLDSGATGILAYDDITATGILVGLADRGIVVPEDVSIIGCDDVLPIRSRPALTTVSASCARAGRAAVSLLIDSGDDPVNGDRRQNPHAELLARPTRDDRPAPRSC